MWEWWDQLRRGEAELLQKPVVTQLRLQQVYV